MSPEHRIYIYLFIQFSFIGHHITHTDTLYTSTAACHHDGIKLSSMIPSTILFRSRWFPIQLTDELRKKKEIVSLVVSVFCFAAAAAARSITSLAAIDIFIYIRWVSA